MELRLGSIRYVAVVLRVAGVGKDRFILHRCPMPGLDLFNQVQLAQFLLSPADL